MVDKLYFFITYIEVITEIEIQKSKSSLNSIKTTDMLTNYTYRYLREIIIYLTDSVKFKNPKDFTLLLYI